MLDQTMTTVFDQVTGFRWCLYWGHCSCEPGQCLKFEQTTPDEGPLRRALSFDLFMMLNKIVSGERAPESKSGHDVSKGHSGSAVLYK